MHVKPKLALTIFIAPASYYKATVVTKVPGVDIMIMIFKTVDIGVALIKVSNFNGTPDDIRVVPMIVLTPGIAAVAL
jgi:hypothetical protein